MPAPTRAVVAPCALLLLALTACGGIRPATPTPYAMPSPYAELGSASSADTSSWRDTHARTLAELLEGRFPGVDVRSLPGDGISVRIRGAGSPVLGSEPLYVLDGIPLDPGPTGILPVQPADVQRIEVLRGAAATAAWGSRGMNGVIVITTRRQ